MPRRPAPPAAAARPTPARGLTVNVEDYLKAIYELELRGGAAATNDIAATLAVAPASVSGMVRRLAEQGLLDHTRYRGVTLTPAGRQAALLTIRRHRIIEAYLAIALGLPWDRVHDEAERLEHAVSDELVDRMAAAIGEPLTDPHGAPIPTREGRIEDRRHHRPLATLDAGRTARVHSVSDRDPGLLRYCDELGVRPGATVTVESRAPYDGPLTLAVRPAAGGRLRRHQVGQALAERVFVEPLEAADAGAPVRRPRAASR
jgi:DtxR family Mn-dependent transcriptional regulator